MEDRYLLALPPTPPQPPGSLTWGPRRRAACVWRAGWAGRSAVRLSSSASEQAPPATQHLVLPDVKTVPVALLQVLLKVSL